MNVEIQINNRPQPEARFVTWAPSPCRIRITNPAGSQGNATPNIRINAGTTTGGGSVVFRQGTTGQFASSLTLPVPINGNWVQFSLPAASDGRVSTWET